MNFSKREIFLVGLLVGVVLLQPTRRGIERVVGMVTDIVSLDRARGKEFRTQMTPRYFDEAESFVPKANVFLISIDTLRADHLGCYGYELNTSPNIDRFSTESAVIFENNFSSAPWTLPSHASIFSSLHPVTHGAQEVGGERVYQIRKDRPLLAELFQYSGYQTISYNGGACLDGRYGFDRGFDLYESIDYTHDSGDNKFWKTIEKTKRWINQDWDSRIPFFMFLHTYEVHVDFNPDRRFLERFGQDYYDGPYPDVVSHNMTQLIREEAPNEISSDVIDLIQGTFEREEAEILLNAIRYEEEQMRMFREKGAEVSRNEEFYGAIGERVKPNIEDRRHIIRIYDAGILSMDEAFGAFITFLKEKQLFDDSLIVLTSDHGEEWWDNGDFFGHGDTLYKEALHVPLIVKFPKNRFKGMRISSLTRSVDIMPTILGTLGMEIPSDVEGVDLLDWFAEEREELFALSQSVQGRNQSSIRNAEWTLIEDRQQNGYFRLLHHGKGRFESQERRIHDFFSNLLREEVAGKSKPELEPVRMEADLEEQLRALGYLE